MLSHSEVQTIVDGLYKDINGYSLSWADRTGPLESEKSFTYGEILLDSLVKMMDLAAPQPGQILYDLGSGIGKTAMMSHLLYPFSVVKGVEFLPSLYAQAMATCAKYDAEIRPTLAEPRGEIMFRHGDMLDEDLSQVDVIFTYPPCFNDALTKLLEERLQTCKQGARIVAPSGLFYGSWLERTHEIEYMTPWETSATGYIYRRV